MRYGIPFLSEGYRRFSINILNLNKKVSGLIVTSFALYLREVLIHMEVGDEVSLKNFGKFVKWKRKVRTDNLIANDSIMDCYVDCIRFVPSHDMIKEMRSCTKKKSPYV